MNENRHDLIIRADFRAMSGATALTTRVSERWKGSGTRSGECVSIFPGQEPVPFVRTTTKNKSTTPRTTTAKVNRAAYYEDMIRKFGSVGNGETD